MTNQKLEETFLSIINPGIKIVEKYADEMKQVRASKPPLGNSKSKKFLKINTLVHGKSGCRYRSRVQERQNWIRNPSLLVKYR